MALGRAVSILTLFCARPVCWYLSFSVSFKEIFWVRNRSQTLFFFQVFLDSKSCFLSFLLFPPFLLFLPFLLLLPSHFWRKSEREKERKKCSNPFEIYFSHIPFINPVTVSSIFESSFFIQKIISSFPFLLSTFSLFIISFTFEQKKGERKNQRRGQRRMKRAN